MGKFSAKVGVTALFALALFAFPISQASAAIVKAQCNKGESLQDRLDNKAKAGDTVIVTGTCNERITVNIGNVTIDGLGTAIIDGTGIAAPGSLLRVRALNVRILNLTVQNSPESGIGVSRGGAAIIQGVTSTGNVRHGIAVTKAAHAVIGPEGRVHPATAGDPPGNDLSGNTRNGINVRNGANADIFHNLITGNRRGINISNNGSAEIDGNKITGNSDAGIRLSENGAARFSDNPNHHGTAANPAEEELENNLIEENGEGLRCRRGGAGNGNEQNFGVGNPGTGGTPHSNDALIADDCHVRTRVFE